MRFVMMLVGLGLMVLAGLWFFTPVLDATYARHAPGIAQSHARTSATAPSGTRSTVPAPSSSSGQSSAQVGSKALADNFMSMINVLTGILGAVFTFLSYRAQASQGRRARD